VLGYWGRWARFVRLLWWRRRLGAGGAGVREGEGWRGRWGLEYGFRYWFAMRCVEWEGQEQELGSPSAREGDGLGGTG